MLDVLKKILRIKEKNFMKIKASQGRIFLHPVQKIGTSSLNAGGSDIAHLFVSDEEKLIFLRNTLLFFIFELFFRSPFLCIKFYINIPRDLIQIIR